MGTDFNNFAQGRSDDELRTAIDGARHANGAAKSVATFPWADLGKFLTELEAPALIRRWLPQGAWVLLYGPPKTFKSFIAIDMDMSIAAGFDFQGCATECGEVVYLSGEGKAGVRKRLNAWLKHNRLKLDALGGRFHLLPLPLRLDDKATVDQLIEDIRLRLSGRRLLTFTIDTVSRYSAADQNSPNDMHTGFIDPVARIMAAFPGSTALCVHHEGKTEGRGARGTNALAAAADVILKTARPDMARPNFTFEMEYAKDWESPPTMALQFHRMVLSVDEERNEISSGVIVEDAEGSSAAKAKAKAKAPKLGAPETVALKALSDLIAREGKVPPANPHIPRNKPCVTEKDWRNYAISRGLSESDDPDNQKRAFRRARTKLIAVEKVANWQHFSWLT
jgi:hypothetical protein